MINETPIEILELPNQLRSLFTGKVPEASSGTAEAKETNFLSRALAAYAIHRLSGCSIEDAAASVVDGGGDGGIDAIFYVASNSTMFIVQSKYIVNGRGEPDCGDFCARVLANRASLWSMDEVASDAEPMPSIYSRVFRADRSARTVWRAVQVQRAVIKVMQDNGKEIGRAHV